MFRTFSYWSSPSVHHLEAFPQWNSSNHENCNIKFSLKTFSNQITIWNFFWNLWLNKSMLEQKSKYLNFIRVFPFFISFFCWNEINKKSSIKKDTWKMENCKADNIPEKHFLRELLEIGVSDHYARKIYIKVSLKVAVPWVLLTSKILF